LQPPQVRACIPHWAKTLPCDWSTAGGTCMGHRRRTAAQRLRAQNHLLAPPPPPLPRPAAAAAVVVVIVVVVVVYQFLPLRSIAFTHSAISVFTLFLPVSPDLLSTAPGLVRTYILPFIRTCAQSIRTFRRADHGSRPHHTTRHNNASLHACRTRQNKPVAMPADSPAVPAATRVGHNVTHTTTPSPPITSCPPPRFRRPSTASPS